MIFHILIDLISDRGQIGPKFICIYPITFSYPLNVWFHSFLFPVLCLIGEMCRNLPFFCTFFFLCTFTLFCICSFLIMRIQNMQGWIPNSCSPGFFLQPSQVRSQERYVLLLDVSDSRRLPHGWSTQLTKVTLCYPRLLTHTLYGVLLQSYRYEHCPSLKPTKTN